MRSAIRGVYSSLPALLLLTLLSLTLGQAEEGPPGVSHGKLQAFARAFVKIGEIYNDYEGRIKTLDNADEASRLQQEGNEKMKGVVAQEGLTVDEYNTIFETAQHDEQFRDKVNQLITKERQH